MHAASTKSTGPRTLVTPVHLYITETKAPRKNFIRRTDSFCVGRGWGREGRCQWLMLILNRWRAAIQNSKNRPTSILHFIGRKTRVCRYAISPSQLNLPCDLSFINSHHEIPPQHNLKWCPSPSSAFSTCRGWLPPKDLEQGHQTSHLTSPVAKESDPYFLLEGKNSKTT